MAIANLKPDLERVRYWQGQLLTAADLREQVATDQELRRLHDQCAHDATGIGIGLQVSLSPSQGVATQALVAPGLAYDGVSRALVLSSPRSVPVPEPLEGAHALVISADAGEPTGVAVRWRPVGERTRASGVALAVLKPGAPEVGPELDDSFRPVVARPRARPFTVQGQTIPGQTSWQPWKLGQEEVGVQVRVDTSIAGFTTVPHYFAEALVGRVDPSVQAAWFVSIGDPSPTQFTLRLFMRGITAQSLLLVDPRPQVQQSLSLDEIEVAPEPPELLPDGSPSGDARPVLTRDDAVVRLSPIVDRAVLISELEDQRVTVEAGLNAPAHQRLGICLLPRIERFTSTSEQLLHLAPDADGVELTDADALAINASAEVQWAEVETVFTSRLIEVNHVIGAAQSELVVVRVRDTIQRVEDFIEERGEERIERCRVWVDHWDRFEEKADVIRLVENQVSARAQIITKQRADDPKDRHLVLSRGIGLRAQETLGMLSASKFHLAEPPARPWQRVRLEGEGEGRFRVGDPVTRWESSGEEPKGLRVEHIHAKTHDLVLNGSFGGSISKGSIAAAITTVRGTIRSVAPGADPSQARLGVERPVRFGGTQVRVFGSPLGPTGPISAVSPGTTDVTLDAPPSMFRVGQVIGRQEFPRFVTVEFVDATGVVIRTSPPLGLALGEVVAATDSKDLAQPLPRRGLALVESIAGVDIRLTRAIDGLKPGERLFVVHMGSVVETQQAPDAQLLIEDARELRVGDGQLLIDDARELRVGDALGLVAGWRQSDLEADWVSVTNADSPNSIALDSWPDGLLPRDVLGLASLRFPTPDRFRTLSLRVKELPTLFPGVDKVSLDGRDAVARDSVGATGIVTRVRTRQRRITLAMPFIADAVGREYRPSAMAASVQFLLGSALNLIRNQDLFVTWFACEGTAAMPRVWTGPEALDCPCSPPKEP